MGERNPTVETREILRAAGLRATRARIAVLNLVFEADSPMSHSDVHELLVETGIDKSTVFRSLQDRREGDRLILLRRLRKMSQSPAVFG